MVKTTIGEIQSGLRPVYTEHLRLRHPLTLMVDANAFFIEIYRKMQTLSPDVNGSLDLFYSRPK